MAFLDELKAWGPGSAGLTRGASPEIAVDYCRRLATAHYENFPLVSWMLPRELHRHFYAVYAYCRWADDLGDEVKDPAKSLELLAWWRDELNACMAGSARHPVFVELTRTMREFEIPRQPFDDLISAFEQDQRIVEYDTFEQLRDYCRRSADPVGRIVLYLCRQYTEQHAEWSDSICTGLQLANFWQDVARDAEIGRIYLPAEDRWQFGYSRADYDRRAETPEFRELMQFEVARARDWLTAGLPLVEQLPGRLQVDIELFARGGLRILDRIEQQDFRVWSRRPVVTKWDAVELMLRTVGRGLIRGLLRPKRDATA